MMRRLFVVLACTVLLPAALHAQDAGVITQRDLEVLRLQATPIGALPPMPLPMPASRDHNYWSVRLQSGYRAGRTGDNLLAVGGGVDMQLLGGSAFGVTGGYQQRDCIMHGQDDCGSHLLASVAARINVLSGGPGTIAELFGDYSGTTTIGVSTSFGYAPDVANGMDACTYDLGTPVSSSMFQKLRVTAFITPSIVWDLGCGPDTAGPASFRLAGGVGVLQLGHRGFDVFLGGQRYLRGGTGYSIGLTFVYVHLP